MSSSRFLKVINDFPDYTVDIYGRVFNRSGKELKQWVTRDGYCMVRLCRNGYEKSWMSENGPYGIEKVIQGAKTESVPLGELKKLSEERMLIFDEDLMTFAMGNCITIEDTNGNRKLMKKRSEQKIDAVAAMMDAYIAYRHNPEAFE